MVSFQGKYEILSALNDGESQSFRALQISSGRPVLVHHLAAGRTPSPQPDLASLIFRFLRSASAEQDRNFLDMGEDEGRIFVVTADVPECLDLRQWLQSVTEAQAGKEGDAQPAGEGTPDSRMLEFTRNFSTYALRQISRSPGSEPVPPAEKSPGVLILPSEIPAASSEVTDRTPSEFTAFWGKHSQANPAQPTASTPAPPTLPKGSEGTSGVPEVTPEFSFGRPSLSIHDSPTVAMANFQAQSADRERAPAAVAGPTEAKGDAGQFAGLLLPPPEMKKPPLAPREAEVSKPSSQPAVPPASDGPETQTPREYTGLLVEKDKAPLQAAALSPAPKADDRQEAEETLAENVPRRPIAMGFEVVFQSSKPRSHPTLSGAPDQSGIVPTPGAGAPRTRPEEAAPTLATADLPKFTPPAVSPGAERMGGSPARGFPPAPGVPRQAIGTRKEPSPPPPPPRARQDLPDTGKTARLVAAPPVPPGEYTRMIQNVKAAAGPLSPGVLPAADRPTANPVVSAPAPAGASYLHVPAPHSRPYHEAPTQLRPSLYVAKDQPALPARKRRKVWVPILILSSLFLMAAAVLLYFALRL